MVPMHGGLVSCPPAGMGWQVPTSLGTLQDWQAPLQALLQQTSSAQKPVAHSALDPHPWPLAVRQFPMPSHTLTTPPSPLHVASGVPSGVLVHVPTWPWTLQAWQVPLQAVPQQTLL